MAKEILIADPDKVDQAEFQRIFETTDYELVFAENGEDALLRVKLFKPDLVIAGAGLNEKTGLELCETIKSDPEFKHIPFILLTGMFEDLSEQDRVRVGADGIISRPLREGDVLSLIDQLLEENANGQVETEIVAQEKEWQSLSEMERSRVREKVDFLLEGFEDENEEIIELVDVFEEPEPKMSINDFITPARGEPAGEITPLESWDKLPEEEKKPRERPYGERPSEEALHFSLDEEEETRPKVDLSTESRVSPEEELFEKIEIEEILEKVERLQPSIEKEWPAEAEIGERIEKALPGPELETTEKTMELWDFETALKAGVKGDGETEPAASLGEELQPLTFEETREPERGRAAKFSEEELQSFFLEETQEEERGEPVKPFSAEPLEEELQPFALEEAKEEVSLEVFSELSEIPFQKMDTPPAMEIPLAVEMPLEEEALIEMAEEEFPEAFIEELGEAEISTAEEPAMEKEEKVGLPREVEPPGLFEEIQPSRLVQEVQPSIPVEAIQPSLLVREAQPSALAQEVQPSPLMEAEAPKIFLEEVQPQARSIERHMEEVIGKGVQEMMEGFITKVLPEMTQNILNLTMDRIEKMVKEIVPEIAEKAIQEEIRRLQKGEKD
ncbi:MAG TPA: response regulator [Thermodesulfobacteriota bacterium]|nr:response regulator [Thermodesulfobacteriota bacterium]